VTGWNRCASLRAVTTGYRPSKDAARLAELARPCGHLPLALRVAAERAVSHPCMRLDDLAGLRDESAIWDTLSTGDTEETNAVRTVFAWSTRPPRGGPPALFRRLGLHPGADFGIHAAAAIAPTGTSSTTCCARTPCPSALVEPQQPGPG
jgi:hypothetical protein